MSSKIYSINGPVVTVLKSKEFMMNEMVYVGSKRLMGEVIILNDEKTVIQVYESTVGLKVGDIVEGSGDLLSALLGPGILTNIFDGVLRPLKTLEEKQGAFIESTSNIKSIDDQKLWDTEIKVKENDYLNPGDIFASCDETSLIKHHSMCPPNLKGKVISAKASGKYNAFETLVTIEDENGIRHDLALSQKWPIKIARPSKKREVISKPLITGQRVIDTIFPVAKGGAATVPGGFGAGKTMLQHQVAKWCDADIIVYVGCGERGNEMTQVLEEFKELKDPKSGKPLLDRTILIANTSNMPVAAREASIYTGITLAEYYRDMGYHVAIMADSTSRWAEALREISGRLEEMPAEEGFPAYLPSRIAQFYERSGYTTNLNNTQGSVTIIGAVSPQGGDFLEPVTQNTKRFIRTFWALDKSLAYTRHFPAVNWNQSYSEYIDDLKEWYEENVAKDFIDLRAKVIAFLHEENELMEIVKLIGSDVLPDDQKLILEIAKVIRVGFLQQNAFHKDDTFVPFDKQYRMLKIILYLHKKCKELISRRIPLTVIMKKGLFDKIIKIKYDIPNDNLELLDDYYKMIDDSLNMIE